MALQQARRRRGTFFLLAVVFGLLAAGLTWLGLEQVEERQTSAPAEVKQEPKTPVVFAIQDIPPRTEITADLVEVREIPQSAVHPRAAVSLEEVLGETTRQTINKGDDITFDMLTPRRAEAGLSFVIPKGKRAVAVAINEIVGSGGLVLPGDHVDIAAVCVGRAQSDEDTDVGTGQVAKSALVLQNLEVLAVAQVLTGQELPPSIGEQAQKLLEGGAETDQAVVLPPAQPTAKSLTVAVEPSEAAKLLAYDELCEMRVMLRRFDDHQVVHPTPIYSLSYDQIGLD